MCPSVFLADHPKSDRIIKQLIVVAKKEEEEEEEPLLAITINCLIPNIGVGRDERN